MLVEEGIEPPQLFQYQFSRGGDSADERSGAESALAAQGCTQVLHCPLSNGAFASFGTIEPMQVVRQRAMEPRYD